MALYFIGVYIINTTWALAGTKFLFECWIFQGSKRNLLSPSNHAISCISEVEIHSKLDPYHEKPQILWPPSSLSPEPCPLNYSTCSALSLNISHPNVFQRSGRRSILAKSALELEITHMGLSTSERVGSFIPLNSFIWVGQLDVTTNTHPLIGDVTIPGIKTRDS